MRDSRAGVKGFEQWVAGRATCDTVQRPADESNGRGLGSMIVKTLDGAVDKHCMQHDNVGGWAGQRDTPGGGLHKPLRQSHCAPFCPLAA